MSHAGEALSGLIDGELEPAEEAAVREHLEACAQCADELAQISAVRALVHGLRPVEPPFGFIERLARPHHPGGRTARRRTGVAAVAAMAVASVAVLFFSSPDEGPVAPQMTRLVEVHATSAAGDPISQLVPVAVPVTFRP